MTNSRINAERIEVVEGDITTVTSFLRDHAEIEQVVFVCFARDDAERYRERL